MAGKGICLYPGTTPPELTCLTLGASIQQDVFAIFETAGETLGFTEVLGGE